MKQTESKWNVVQHGIWLLVAMILFIFGAISPAQAEPTGGLTTAGKILMDLLGSTVGALDSAAPIRLQANCSADLGKCWEKRGLNKDNQQQVMDACWQGTKICPKVCKDRYFAQRKAGIKASVADSKVLFGEPSCIPGLDKRVHSVRKKPNNSTLQVGVTVGGQAADANIEVIPLDARGHDVKRTTDGFITANGWRYSMGTASGTLPGSTIKYLPAGQYRLQVRSRDRNYHPQQKFQPYQAFPKQVEQISIKAGQTLDKIYAFGMGRLVVKARNEDGKPVAASVKLRRWDRPKYVLYRAKLPLDTSLIAGKYRLVVTATKPFRSKAFNIEIKDAKSVNRIITFETRAMR